MKLFLMQTQRSGGIFLRMLMEADRRASASAESASAMLADRATVAAVLDGLKRPSAGSAYTVWAASAELAQAARVAAKLAQHGDAALEASHVLQRACIAAAQVLNPPRHQTAAMSPGILELASIAIWEHASCS